MLRVLTANLGVDLLVAGAKWGSHQRSAWSHMDLLRCSIPAVHQKSSCARPHRPTLGTSFAWRHSIRPRWLSIMTWRRLYLELASGTTIRRPTGSRTHRKEELTMSLD